MPRLRLLPPVSVVEDQRDVAPAMEYFMRRGGHIAIDTETTGLRKLDDRVLCWSLATEDRRYFISVEHLFAFDRLFQRRDVTWCLANAKFDMHMLRNHGITLEGPKWDIVVMDALEDDTRPHGLKEQAYYSYGASWGDFKELFLDPHFVAQNLGLDKTSFTSFKKLGVGDKLLFVYDERPDLVHDYASCDAYFTYMRAMDLRDSLGAFELPTTIVPEHKSMLDYYETLEVPFTDALWQMERNGFDVDLDYAKSIDGPMRDGLTSYTTKLKRIAGQNFNPNSTDELREILFDDPHGFKLKPVKYGATKTKDSHVAKKSTDEKVLNILLERCSSDKSRPEYIFIDTLLKYRVLKKLHGTYVKNLSKFIASDGRIHSSLNQAGARSARISSSDPNMQNIPARNDPYKIRNVFVAPPGWKLIDLDYPQIEFRVAAVLADERNMLEPMSRGWDIHSANAAAMFPGDVEYEALMEAVRTKDAKGDLTAEMRRLISRRGEAKTSGLGCMFGEGARKMAADLGCSVDDAQALIERFHSSFPSLSALIYEMHDFGHEHEMTYTMLGRVRRLWKINCGKRGLEAAEERQSFNCFDYSTEVLTPEGWKNGHQVVEGDTLLTKNAVTGALEWQVAAITHFPEYDGDLHLWQSRSFSAATTPNHRWLVDTKGGLSSVCQTTDQFRGHGDERIHRTGNYVPPCPNELNDDEIQLLGWAATDSTHRQQKHGVSIIISQTKPEMVAEIDELMSRFGVARSSNPNTNGQYFWNLKQELSSQYEPWVRGRLLSYPLLWSLTQRQARLLLRTIQKADGEKICASSKEKAERYQILAQLAGYHASILRREPSERRAHSPKVQSEGIQTKQPYYVVAVCRRSRAQVTKKQMSVVRGQGVWCPSVPNTYVVVRHHDHVYITGQTPVQGSAAEMMKLAILRTMHHPRFRELGGEAVLTVHDELIARAPAETAEEVRKVMLECMGDPYRWGPIQLQYPIPIEPDGHVINRWGEAK